MSELDLDAIKARADAATPGPWVVVTDSIGGLAVGFNPDGNLSFYAGFGWDDEAEFISHARDDVPALVDEVKLLRTELATTRKQRDQEAGWNKKFALDTADLLRPIVAERDALQAKLDEAERRISEASWRLHPEEHS